MPDRVALLRARSPQYPTRLEDIRALIDGEEAFEARKRELLPRYDAEMADSYEARLKSAEYVNDAGPIVARLLGFLLSEPLKPAEGDAWWAEWLAQLDLQALARDALVAGRCAVWLDLPEVSQAEFGSRLEQEQAGALRLRPIRVPPEALIDWQLDADGRVLWAVLEERLSERDGPMAERRQRWRWTVLTSESIERWTAPVDTSGEHPPQLEARVAHGFGRAPLVLLQLPHELWLGARLRAPATELLRGRTNLTWALNRGAHSLLVLYTKTMPSAPTLGAGYYLRLGQEDRAEFVEPAGKSFELLAQAVKDQLADLYRVVDQMAVEAAAKSARQSGESKERDWQTTELLLSAYAGHLRAWAEQVLAFVAEVVGREAPSLAGLEGWHTEDVEAWLLQVGLATDARQLSGEFRRHVAKRQVALVLPDLDAKDRKAIDADIDAADTDPWRPSGAPGTTAGAPGRGPGGAAGAPGGGGAVGARGGAAAPPR